MKEAKMHSDTLFQSCKRLYQEVKQIFKEIKPEPVPSQPRIEVPQIEPQPRVQRVTNTSNDVEFLLGRKPRSIETYVTDHKAGWG